VQVDDLDPVELQHPGERVENLVGGGLGLALLQSRVVPRTHPSELGKFLTS
jgi:hypothetical protein